VQEYARKDAEKDALFLQLVSDGMTRADLEKLIAKRPALWGRYAEWLGKLPIDKDHI
jgi:hypothetical protein